MNNYEWKSLFLTSIENIKDKDIKIRILIKRVIELERENKRRKFRKEKNKNPNNNELMEFEPQKSISAKEFYNSKKWKDLRFDFLSNSRNLECVLCKSDKNLHVDHIIPRSVDPLKAYDKNNLQILCEKCNIGKGTKTIKIIKRSNL